MFREGDLSNYNTLDMKRRSIMKSKGFRGGFTLIELLAVIVILALIALIAIPMIMNVIESSKKGAYEESLRNLMKATEYYETSEEILGNIVDFTNGLSVLDSHIEMKNKNFKTGMVKKNANGELYLENVSDGVYCGNGTIDKLTITKGSCEGIEPPTVDTSFTFDSILTDEASGANGSINVDTLGNKRFAGVDPNNYVCFGMAGDVCDDEHLYRIIGVIDMKPKLIKNSYYSEGIAWDRAGGTYGSNDWGRPADLKTELNGNAFYGNTNYIDATHKTYITNATWYTGGIAGTTGKNYISSFELAERVSQTTGYIGLMSVTDFGYASNDANCSKETTDLNVTNNACMNNNWLFDNGTSQWTITPRTDGVNRVWFAVGDGNMGNAVASDTYFGARPSMFLDSKVKIKSGEGTQAKPYILIQ